MNFAQFLTWEQATHDTIDFKKIYVDMVQDVNAGLLLSEIVYWYLPSRKGESKLRVQHNGKFWIACRRAEWWDRTRLSPKQADRGLTILLEALLIEKARFKFDGEVTLHVRLLEPMFLRVFEHRLEHPLENPYRGENGISPKVNLVIPQKGNSESPKGQHRFRQKGQIRFTHRVKPLSPKGRNPVTAIPSTTTSEITSETTTTVVVVDPVDQSHWDAAFHQLEMQLDRASFETWLRGAWLKQVERADCLAPGDTTVFVIAVRNSYARETLQHRLYRNIRRVLSDVGYIPADKLALYFEIDTPVPSAPHDDSMPLFRLLAQHDPTSPTLPLHEQISFQQTHVEQTIRELFERFITPITASNEKTVKAIEAMYSVEDFAFLCTEIAGKRANGLIRTKPYTYLLGVLRNQSTQAG